MKRDSIILKYFCRSIHCAQVFTSFHSLRKGGRFDVFFEDHTADASYPYKTAIAELSYRGKTIIYDMLDGYNDLDAIRWFYSHCDFYFKRSFSSETNRMLGFDENKMFPWGFNYHVSFLGNPCEGDRKPQIKEIIKLCMGKETNTFFSPSRFECLPVYKDKDKVKILFMTRLWPESQNLTQRENEERRERNIQRIQLIRHLREKYDSSFLGGLQDSVLTRDLAPDLIVPDSMTSRKKYLQIMHQCDICIGTAGLHNSTGWKTAEYIAASKGIVLEKMHYEVPGSFLNGTNYLEFQSEDECMQAVSTLADNADYLYSMRQQNYQYYLSYLSPESIANNSIRTIDALIG